MIMVNNRDKLQWHEGMTVQDVLDAMRYKFSLIIVTINGEIVPKDDYETQQVPDDADVKAIHIMHGG